MMQRFKRESLRKLGISHLSFANTNLADFFLQHGYRYHPTVCDPEKSQNTYSATDIFTGTKVIAYVFDARSIKTEKSRNLWRFLKHKHILRCIDTFLSDDGLDRVYVTDFCGNGSVSGYVESGKFSSLPDEEKEKLCRKWALQCIKALTYAKTLGVFTRDFDLRQVLLDDRLNVKLATVNSLTHVGPKQTKSWGILAGRCPEARRYLRMTQAKAAHANMFLVGSALFQMLSWGEKREGLHLAKGVSEDAKDFVKALLEPDWKERVLHEEALEHPWMQLAEKENAPQTMINPLFRRPSRQNEYRSPESFLSKILSQDTLLSAKGSSSPLETTDEPPKDEKSSEAKDEEKEEIQILKSIDKSAEAKSGEENDAKALEEDKLDTDPVLAKTIRPEQSSKYTVIVTVAPDGNFPQENNKGNRNFSQGRWSREKSPKSCHQLRWLRPK